MVRRRMHQCKQCKQNLLVVTALPPAYNGRTVTTTFGYFRHLLKALTTTYDEELALVMIFMSCKLLLFL